MKNKNYNEKMVLGCLILGISLVSIAIAIAIHFVEKIERPVIYINHIVKQNEHLDDIANKYYPDTYVLEARSDIKKLNNMKESVIYEGQTILVKVEVK